MMENDIVTIVIATYNRPDVLKTAIQSVINQTLKNWKLFVIGDCCDERTDEVISAINDKRVHYINLQERFGEQSGPNSIGMALAETPYLSFLNHDDLWLSDHLETGISVLKKDNYDFYLSGTAFTFHLIEKEENLEIPVDLINTENRKTLDFFTKKFLSFEPASSWILVTAKANEIGYWNFYTDLYRYPIEDFLLRAVSLKSRFYFAKNVTVWNFQTHNNNKTINRYNYKSTEHQIALKLIMNKSPDDMRAEISERLNLSIRNEKQNKSSWLTLLKITIKNILINKYSFRLFTLTKIDIFSLFILLKFQTKGDAMKETILRRTGAIPLRPDKNKIIRELKMRSSYRNNP